MIYICTYCVFTLWGSSGVPPPPGRKLLPGKLFGFDWRTIFKPRRSGKGMVFATVEQQTSWVAVTLPNLSHDSNWPSVIWHEIWYGIKKWVFPAKRVVTPGPMDCVLSQNLWMQYKAFFRESFIHPLRSFSLLWRHTISWSFLVCWTRGP